MAYRCIPRTSNRSAKSASKRSSNRTRLLMPQKLRTASRPWHAPFPKNNERWTWMTPWSSAAAPKSVVEALERSDVSITLSAPSVELSSNGRMPLRMIGRAFPTDTHARAISRLRGLLMSC
jgi:hypothetical protein